VEPVYTFRAHVYVFSHTHTSSLSHTHTHTQTHPHTSTHTHTSSHTHTHILTQGLPCGSRGPVLSLAMTSSGEQCFSGGIDSTIQWWNLPSSNVDPYDSYGTAPPPKPLFPPSLPPPLPPPLSPKEIMPTHTRNSLLSPAPEHPSMSLLQRHSAVSRMSFCPNVQ